MSATDQEPREKLWRPTCYVCGRFVITEAYDVSYDYYSGAWEEGYTACPEHGGPSRTAPAEETR